MLLADLVATSQAVGATRSRTAKTARIAELLRSGSPSEAHAAARFLAGRSPRVDVGWATLSGERPPPAETPTLTLADVDAAVDQLAEVGGAGARTARLAVLADLLGRATADEQQFLVGLLLGEVRHGALEGVVVQGIAAAAEVGVVDVQRALMRSGDLGDTAETALAGGAAALRAVRFEVMRPVQPMLAATAADVEAALAEHSGPGAVEAKLDGARVQVHRRGDEVRVWTRSLREVSRPEVVEVVAGLDVGEVVLDGEVLALAPDGRPRPFSETMSSFGEAEADAQPIGDARLGVFFFDCLRVDGADLLDSPLAERQSALDELVPPAHRVDRLVTDDPAEAEDFLGRVLAAGHEGVVVKDLASAYEAGRRGAAWRKVKPVHTLDLVVLAAEWGSGRRRGWLSNLHLGARDPDGLAGEPGGFVMLGKTFKGLTDETLAWQTERLSELAVAHDRAVVRVRPELVVEIAFDGVLSSSRYPGGVSLRFARVRGYREDKTADEADTLATVRDIHAGRRLPRW